MKNIVIQVVPHNQQRYETVGDWFMEPDGQTLVIRVSELGDWRQEMCVAIHEFAEVLLCQHHGITQDLVDKFDFEFEADRKPGNLDEPGDDVRSPYRREHCFATGIERLLASQLGIVWNDYANKVESLSRHEPQDGGGDGGNA